MIRYDMIENMALKNLPFSTDIGPVTKTSIKFP